MTYLLSGHEQEILKSIFPKLPSLEVREVILSFLPGPEFHLLYRASRDGHTTVDLHRLCDNKGPTVTILTSKEGYIFGGYAQEPWKTRDGYVEDPNAFIFSVKRPGGRALIKLELLRNHECYALRHGRDFGPSFGKLGYEITIIGEGDEKMGAHLGRGSTYQWPVGERPDSFLTTETNTHGCCTLSEIEVYKVTMK